jgi:hypothetical protein
MRGGSLTRGVPRFRTVAVGAAALLAFGVLAACKPPPGNGSDLGVVLVSPPATSSVGETRQVVVGITNHGTAPATGARVGYVVPDALTVAAVTGSRVGTCTGPTLVAGSSIRIGSCAIGTLAPGESTSVEIAIRGVSVSGSTEVHVAATSPDEPAGAGVTNEATVVHQVFGGSTISFVDPGPVPVGSSFVVSGSAPGNAVLEYVQVRVPSNLRVDAVTVSGMFGTDIGLPAGCTGTGSLSCQLPGFFPVSSVSFHVTALAVGGPAPLGISSSSEAGGAYGSVLVQVVDATITSDIHVTYEPVASAVLGEPRTLQGTIRSGGPTPHTGVAVAVAVPAGFTVQSATWGVPAFPCSIVGSNVNCAVGPLAGYRTEPLRVVIVPTATTASATVTTTITSSTAQDVPDPNPDTVTLTFPVYESFVDLDLADITLNRDPFVQTTPGAVELKVRNTGTSTATGVTLVATFPTGLRAARGDMPQPAPAATRYCSQVGQTSTCDIGDLAAGQEQFVRLWAWTDGSTGGDVQLSVTADQPEAAPDPNPNTATVPVTVVPPQADFAVSFPYAPLGPFIVGQPQSVLVRVENVSGATATPVVTLTAPVGWTITPVAPCTVVGQVATCPGWPLAEDRSIDFRVTIGAVVPDPGVELVAAVTTELPDPVPANSQVAVPIDGVAEEVDLGVTVQPATLPLAAPGVVTHRYQITNAGPARATGVVFTATFPGSVELLSANYGCTFSGSTAVCDRSDFGAGESVTVDLTVRYTDVSQAVTHHVAVSADQPERPDATEPNQLDVVVPVPAHVAGRVTLPSGSPAAGVGVRAFSPTDTWFATAYATTGADGSYRLGPLPPGQYQVMFVPPTGSGLPTEWYDNTTSRALARWFVVTTGGEAFVADARLGL